MTDTIEFKQIGDLVCAIYAGPHARQIINLFDTNILPTPFFSVEEAVSEIARLNPGCAVTAE